MAYAMAERTMKIKMFAYSFLSLVFPISLLQIASMSMAMGNGGVKII